MARNFTFLQLRILGIYRVISSVQTLAFDVHRPEKIFVRAEDGRYNQVRKNFVPDFADGRTFFGDDNSKIGYAVPA